MRAVVYIVVCACWLGWYSCSVAVELRGAPCNSDQDCGSKAGVVGQLRCGAQGRCVSGDGGPWREPRKEPRPEPLRERPAPPQDGGGEDPRAFEGYPPTELELPDGGLPPCRCKAAPIKGGARGVSHVAFAQRQRGFAALFRDRTLRSFEPKSDGYDEQTVVRSHDAVSSPVVRLRWSTQGHLAYVVPSTTPKLSPHQYFFWKVDSDMKLEPLKDPPAIPASLQKIEPPCLGFLRSEQVLLCGRSELQVASDVDFKTVERVLFSDASAGQAHYLSVAASYLGTLFAAALSNRHLVRALVSSKPIQLDGKLSDIALPGGIAHQKRIEWIGFGASATRMLSLSQDSLKMWDLNRGQLVSRLRFPSGFKPVAVALSRYNEVALVFPDRVWMLRDHLGTLKPHCQLETSNKANTSASFGVQVPQMFVVGGEVLEAYRCD